MSDKHDEIASDDLESAPVERELVSPTIENLHEDVISSPSETEEQIPEMGASDEDVLNQIEIPDDNTIEIEVPQVEPDEEPPTPIRGNDVYQSVKITYDIASYGGRTDFEYTVGDSVRSSSWLVPEATYQGQEFRFLGKGEAGSFGGGDGDLVISIEVEESPRTRDITHDITIPWDNSNHQHLAKITLNRGNGDEVIQFSIPAHIRTGQYIRVRGAGNLSHGDLHPGDLIIKVTVSDPLPPEDLHAYAVVNFWSGVKLFFFMSPKVKIYKISNNNFVKSFKKLKKKHTPEISWTFPGEGEEGKGLHPNSDLHLTPHYTGKAYSAPAISSLMIVLILGLLILGQQTLTWTGENAFYAKYLSEPVQSGPSSSTRNENITFETTKPTWAPDGFQLIDSDPNIAIRMPDPETYDCTSAKTLNCLNVEVYAKVKCGVLNASVVFYSEDLKVNESSSVKLNNLRDLNITTVKFFPQSKKPFPKWDFLSITCVQSK
jgi:hypothetical protein